MQEGTIDVQWGRHEAHEARQEIHWGAASSPSTMLKNDLRTRLPLHIPEDDLALADEVAVSCLVDVGGA